MHKPTNDEIKEILRLHKMWLRGDGGSRADLSDADPSGADLSCADLSGADLSGADLSRADLSGANFYGANLSCADLSGANLSGANLSGANLSDANFYGANLSGANLSGANLSDANFYGANLSGANLSPFRICPDGTFRAYKKLRNDIIATLEIPEEARRLSTPVGRKCRAEFALVKSLSSGSVGYATHDGTKYRVGEIVRPDSYDDDWRIECSHGIHFFITREEAENY